MPDTPWPAALGKLVGITAVTPSAVELDVSAPLLCCCTDDAGEMNTVACFALDG